MSFVAKYYTGDVEVIDYTPSVDTAAGTVVPMGTIFGVATEDLPANRPASLAISGVFAVTKAAANAMTRGAVVAWDVGNTRVDDTLTVGKPFGTVYRAPVTADTTVLVRLNDRVPPQAAVVAALAQDISASPTESEVQAISTKVDAILTALKAAGLMANA
jgi:predicted RecA/RadA family phage recombinase